MLVVVIEVLVLVLVLTVNCTLSLFLALGQCLCRDRSCESRKMTQLPSFLPRAPTSPVVSQLCQLFAHGKRKTFFISTRKC